MYRCVFCCNPDSWSPSGGNPIHVDDLVAAILRCKPYMVATDGGVTVSGGDPMVQPEFVARLFSRIRAEGLSTCIDTTGFVAPSASGLGVPPEETDEEKTRRAVLRETDHVLLCVKHPDPEKYLSIAGCPRHGYQQMLRFLRSVAAEKDSRAPDRPLTLTLRYVLIPGKTDSAEDLDQLAAFANDPEKCPQVECIELLPLHQLGAYKYADLQIDYPMENFRTPTKEEVTRARERLEGHGLRVLL
jgi:pyruvate formate lyase activating enzyme